jgi:hypothetical protein
MGNEYIVQTSENNGNMMYFIVPRVMRIRYSNNAMGYSSLVQTMLYNNKKQSEHHKANGSLFIQIWGNDRLMVGIQTLAWIMGKLKS